MNKKGGLANNAETSFEKDIWYVLTKVKELLQYVKGERISYYDYFNVIQQDSNHSISSQAEKLVINQLQEIGVVKIEPYKFELEDYQSIKMVGTGKAYITKPIPLFESLAVMRKKFDGVYEEYRQKNTKNKNVSSKLIFYLTSKGELSRHLESGEKQFYKMEMGKNKHKLVEILLEQREPIKADDIAQRIQTTSDIVRKEIGVLRGKIEKHFKGINGKDFIPDGERGVGYCLGPRIVIKQT